jgi:ribosomal protein L32
MAYLCDLGTGQKVYIENRGTQSAVTLVSSSAGQQQSQRSSFETGEWLVPPTLFRVSTGFVLQLESRQAKTFVTLQPGGMSVLNAAPALIAAQALPMQQVTSETIPNINPMPPMQPMQPMEPLKPMPPMQMGDMQMRMEPMEMQMGNMRLSMGTLQATPGVKNFCPQCGHKVETSDRFCAHCGNSLTN